MLNSLQSFASFASNSIPLPIPFPVETPESYPPHESLSSSDDDDDNIILQQITYNQHYIRADNSKAVLLSMAIGLTNSQSELIFDPENDELWKKSNVWKSIKPKKAALRNEILRRKDSYSGLNLLKIPNSQKSRDVHVQWLMDNTYLTAGNKAFVISTLNDFMKTITDAQEPEKDPEKFMNFRGHTWILRMIHSLVDHDDARLSFAGVYDSMNRTELDGKKNPGTARVTAWQKIADHFNDPNFNPRSTAYPLLHKAFNKPIDLSHSVFAKHGPIDATKVKDKFSDMKCKLTIIKTNHDASGEGEGSLTNDDEIAAGSAPGTLPSVGSFDDRRSFLGANNPALLYLWEKTEEFELFGVVMQKISDDVALGDRTHSVTKTNKNKRKSPSAETEGLTEGLKASTLAFNRFNMSNAMRDKRDLQRELMEAEDRVDELRGVSGKERQLQRHVKYVRTLEGELDKKERIVEEYVAKGYGGSDDVVE